MKNLYFQVWGKELYATGNEKPLTEAKLSDLPFYLHSTRLKFPPCKLAVSFPTSCNLLCYRAYLQILLQILVYLSHSMHNKKEFLQHFGTHSWVRYYCTNNVAKPQTNLICTTSISGIPVLNTLVVIRNNAQYFFRQTLFLCYWFRLLNNSETVTARCSCMLLAI